MSHREDIEKITGVPASLLTGNTVEEDLAQAKALMNYKREAERTEPEPEPKTSAQVLGEWFEQQLTVKNYRL